jgi:hypothetical protein
VKYWTTVCSGCLTLQPAALEKVTFFLHFALCQETEASEAGWGLSSPKKKHPNPAGENTSCTCRI